MPFICLDPESSLNEMPLPLKNLLPHWERLAVEPSQGDPFCCGPCWNLPALRVLSPPSRILFRASSRALVLLAEYRFEDSPVLLAPLESSWLFGCPLLGDAREATDLLTAALMEALAGILEETKPAFPRIALSGLNPEGNLALALFRRFGRDFGFYRHSSSAQCTASLQGGLDGFLSRRSANHRAKLRKASRRAAEHGISFTRCCPTTEEEANAVYERMLAVERVSWKGLGQCGMAESPARDFYADMMRCLVPERRARIIFARHEEQDIGFIFGGMAGRIYRGQQFSYNAAWKDWSIGNLMQLEKVTWLCEEGAERYDMGPIVGQRMEYKSHWTEEKREIQTWLLQKN